MHYDVRFEKSAQKELEKLPKFYQDRIVAVLPEIASNPFVGKKLKGEMTGVYSYRVWPYRILYRVYKGLVLVVIIHVGHRQGAYKK